MLKVKQIRQEIIASLKRQGFKVKSCGEIVSNAGNNYCKDKIRKLHKQTRIKKIISDREFILKNFQKLAHFFADGTDIDVNKFDPSIQLVEPNTIFAELFRFATHLWSVPVSQGYGRRVRFIVLDKYNNKLAGLFALGDPVFNLGVRDAFIGWDHHMRGDRLYNVLDLFIAGAVPPYAELLVGKFVAMLATSNEVRKIIWNKYNNKATNIRGEEKKPHLVLITTSSALGRSSIYNRLSYDGRPMFFPIGDTIGWGHFHLSNGSFGLMREYLKKIDHPIYKSNRFGQGPNWKIRAIRICLESLGLPTDMLRHGIKRQVFLAPIAENYIDYLTGVQKRPKYYKYAISDLVSFFKDRWFIPRAGRSQIYLDVKSAQTLEYIKRVATKS